MRDSIYTIPVSEVFDPKCGCPICRLRDTLETRSVDYIMGAAMMEPDVRIETNRLGFCENHYEMMLHQKNRLSLALILESGLKEVKATGLDAIVKKAQLKPKKREGVKTVNDTCFVCEKIDWAMNNMLETVVRLYRTDESFRKLFSEQEYLCLPHLEQLLTIASGKMNKKELPLFTAAAVKLTEQYLDIVLKDVSHFCSMYDYRNAGPNADWGNSRDSIERAIALLSTRDHR